MDAQQWMIQNSGSGLLLVAVDLQAATTPGAWPCQVVGMFTPSAPGAQRTDGRISRLLAEVGVPGNLLGCAYLRTALALLLEEPGLGRAITRRLYPCIAQRHATSAPGVERAIRHAIAQTFSRGSENYRATLGRLASSVGEKPTNAEFLAQLAEYLRLSA